MSDEKSVNSNIKIDYNKIMENEISLLSDKFPERKPSILLHACCGPCSTACIERLVPHFDVTIFFYNPNIEPFEEFDKRLEAQKKFLSTCEFCKDVKLIVPDYQHPCFIDAIDLQNFPERRTERECGSRCNECYKFRLIKTADYASKNSFDYWTTTLTLSPYKDAKKVNNIGRELEESGLYSSTKFLHCDFKKKEGYKRSIELSKEYGLYRQDYCGCLFGKAVADKFIAQRQLEKSQLCAGQII